MGNIEELNNIISQLKEDNFSLKKDLKETLNRKSQAEIKTI